MEREAYRIMDAQEATHWWFVARRRIIDALIRDLVCPPAHARILEAGCGTGGNLSLLAGYGELSAFEYDPEARATAARKSGIDVAPGALPDGIGFADGSFDLIAMLDVLEHLDEDEASLAALKAKLADHGKLLITVPAAPWLWSEHDELHHHKRRYTKGQLEMLLRKLGFSEIKVGYFNALLFPLAVLDRVLRNLGLRKGSGSDEVGSGLNRVLERVFSWEAVLLRKVAFPFGLSLYAVVVRN